MEYSYLLFVNVTEAFNRLSRIALYNAILLFDD